MLADPRDRDLAGEGPWLAFAAAALVAGAALLSWPVAAGLAAVLTLSYAFLRSPLRSEIVVGAFWIAFTVYETVFAEVTIPGFFYPFYLAFLVAIVAGSLRDGLRVRLPLLLPYAAFLMVVLVSFVGFGDPVDFGVVQRVVAYLLGALVLLQFRSPRGAWPVLTAAVVASSTISAWVVVSAIEGGFVYRGDIEVDQNVVAFFVGFGVLVAAGLGLHVAVARGRRAWLLALAPVLGVTLYASLLLASRGMALALGVALLAVLVRAVLRDRRALAFVVVFIALAGGALLLPGGQGLLERFEGERIETGGSRLPIWEATLEAYADGGVQQLVLGNGYDSSQEVVARTFGSITSTHNAFVQVLYEFGLAGLVSFLLVHVVLLLRSTRVASPYGPIMLGLTCFLIAANLSTNASDGFMYWVVWGTVAALGTWGGSEPTGARADA